MPTQKDADLARFEELDRKLIGWASQIKILSTLAWPNEIQVRFLDGWQRKQPIIPVVSYPSLSFKPLLVQLDEFLKETDTAHPIGCYLHETALSYRNAALMLENLGKPEMTHYSIALYGKPGDILRGSSYTNIDAAWHFINAADEFWRDFPVEDEDTTRTAEDMKRELQEFIAGFFTRHTIEVVIDKALAAKAAAGGKRIRLRAGTSFSDYDYNQLLQHEALVHSLTAINGQAQPHLKSLGLGAPRTTATQEGLATFAELVTGSIDINRLKRIALRIIAVDMALDGADFIEVFQFFLDAGQSEVESYNSSMRIFRGGMPSGVVAFTKDTVYLQGLLSTHTFLRWAMQGRKLQYSRHLFAGRLTFEDAVRLEPFFKNGYISEAIYLPPWLKHVQGLAAYLAFSLFADKIHIEDIIGRDFR